MNRIFFIAVLILSSMPIYAVSETNEAPVLTKAPVTRIFVPQGFHEPDNIEIIIYGEFANGCHSVGPASAQLDLAQKKVLVSANAYFHPGVVCTLKVVPFTQSVVVQAVVPAGIYQVEVLGQSQVEPAELVVGQALGPVDSDVLYASVRGAVVNRTAEGETIVILFGRHPFLLDGCMKFDTIQTFVTENNVVDVSPITKIVTDSDCDDVSHNNQFLETITISESLPRGEYLLHVRTLSGKAINQVVNIGEP